MAITETDLKAIKLGGRHRLLVEVLARYHMKRSEFARAGLSPDEKMSVANIEHIVEDAINSCDEHMAR